MQITDLCLPELPINEAHFGIDPQSKLAQARRVHPWLAHSPVGFVITDYFAARDLLGMDDRLRTAEQGVIAIMKAEGSSWGRWQQRHINHISGEDHARIRRVLAPMFTPRTAHNHREHIREVISNLLDEWVPKERIDFEEFASYFPITVICEFIGASSSEIPRLRSSLQTLGLSFSLMPEILPQLEDAHRTLENFVSGLIDSRRKNGASDAPNNLLTALVEAIEADHLSVEEVRDLLILLFAAGFDTSKNVLTLLMHELMQRPEIYRRCADDLAYCARVVEEGLRFAGPATVPRLTNCDIIYRDVTIPKDAMLFFPVGILGRDPAVVEDPDVFNPDRTQPHRHLAFGRGMHVCLGQFIARAQIAEGLHLIASRMRDPRPDGAPGWRPFPGVWGIDGLPIRFVASSGVGTNGAPRSSRLAS